MKRFFFLLLASLLLLAAAAGGGCAAVSALAPAADGARPVPILMYHSILKDPARQGDYVLSPDVLDADVAWLLTNGYETVTLRALAAFAGGYGDLPAKPVLLTFDDGYLNNLLYALPVLEKYGCTAVISAVGAYTQAFSDTPDPNPNYAHLSWDDLIALQESGRFEIGNHSYDMHGLSGRKGSSRRRGESDAAYRRAFTADTARLQEALARRVGVTPQFYAYPFGVVGEGSEACLREMGFLGSLTCREAVSTVVRGDPESLWGLGRFNRASGETTDAFMRRTLGGVETGGAGDARPGA